MVPPQGEARSSTQKNLVQRCQVGWGSPEVVEREERGQVTVDVGADDRKGLQVRVKDHDGGGAILPGGSEEEREKERERKAENRIRGTIFYPGGYAT